MNKKGYATQIISNALSILRDEGLITQQDTKEVTGKLFEALNRKSEIKQEMNKKGSLPGDGVSQETAQKAFFGVTKVDN